MDQSRWHKSRYAATITHENPFASKKGERKLKGKRMDRPSLSSQFNICHQLHFFRNASRDCVYTKEIWCARHGFFADNKKTLRPLTHTHRSGLSLKEGHALPSSFESSGTSWDNVTLRSTVRAVCAWTSENAHLLFPLFRHSLFPRSSDYSSVEKSTLYILFNNSYSRRLFSF